MLDLTREQLSRHVGISVQYVGMLESGRSHPSDKVLARLAEVLRLDRRELFF